MKKVLLISLLFLSLTFATLNVTVGDQGDDLVYNSNGSLVESADLTVLVYTAATGGTPFYNETFTGAITNGSWNVMLGEGENLPLDYGFTYYKDYEIDGEDLDFIYNDGSTHERRNWDSSFGQIQANFINCSSLNISDTIWDLTGSNYLYNNSDILWFNETKMNLTIDDKVSGLTTFWNRTGTTLEPYYLGDDITTTGNINATGGGSSVEGFSLIGRNYVRSPLGYFTSSINVGQFVSGSDRINVWGDGNTAIFNVQTDGDAILNGSLYLDELNAYLLLGENGEGFIGYQDFTTPNGLEIGAPVNEDVYIYASGTGLVKIGDTDHAEFDQYGNITTAGNIYADGTIYTNSTEMVCTSENGLCNQTGGSSYWTKVGDMLYPTDINNAYLVLNNSGGIAFDYDEYSYIYYGGGDFVMENDFTGGDTFIYSSDGTVSLEGSNGGVVLEGTHFDLNGYSIWGTGSADQRLVYNSTTTVWELFGDLYVENDLEVVDEATFNRTVTGNANGNVTVNETGIYMEGDARVWKFKEYYAYNMGGIAGTYNGVSNNAAGLTGINGMYLKSFDDGAGAATAEATNIAFAIPGDYVAGTNITITFAWAVGTTATTNVRWQCGITETSTTETFSPNTYTYGTPVNAAAPGTAWERVDQSFEFDGTGYQPRDLLNVIIFRDADNAGDNYVGDSYMHSAGFEYMADKIGWPV